AAAGARAPRTATEHQLAAIWTAVLGVPRTGPDDSFFDLGGHSLLATRMMARVQEAWGVAPSLRTLFERPRLGDLAAWIDGAAAPAGAAGAGAAAPPTPRPPRDRPLPLSFAQQRLWFLEQLQPGTPLYNIPLALDLAGPLPVAALAAALAGVVA